MYLIKQTAAQKIGIYQGNFFLDISYGYAGMGEVFVDGQGRNVWCDSKRLTGLIMTPENNNAIYTTSFSCYALSYFNYVMGPTVDMQLQSTSDYCLTYSAVHYFLCG